MLVKEEPSNASITIKAGLENKNKKINMMNKKTCTMVVLGGMLMMTSCASSNKIKTGGAYQVKDNNMQVVHTDENLDPSFLILSDAQRKVVEGNNRFALGLFKQVAGFDSRVVSPLSVSYLMGMLANGADGQTLNEIMGAIGCQGVSVDELNAFYKDLMEYSAHADKSTVLNIANYVAVNKAYKLNPIFSKAVSENYQAGVESLDFSSSKTTHHINNWCKQHTDGMIPSIIDQVEPSAVSYLMNAIFFNGSWKDKFDKKETKLENFQGYTRDIKKVQMMHQHRMYDYFDNDTFSAVELPYGNGTYTMTVLLPHKDKSIDDMMKTLDVKQISELRSKMDECVVDLKLPKFTTDLELSLNDIISKLGAPSMFDANKANFSKFGEGNLFVSQMIQKAKIEVSEEGTKAAAVTAGIMAMSALRPEPRNVEFHANRPFVYMITDRMSGSIFFMGQFTGSEI